MFSISKKLTSLVAVFSCLIGFSGSVQSEGLKIGMSFQELDNQYFVAMKEALEGAADSIGAEVIVTDARHDVAKQINDVEGMIEKGIDILLLNPTDSVGIQSAVLSAKQAGVVTVAVDAQAVGPLDSYVGSKNYEAGYLAGQYLADNIGGEGEVAILDGISVVPILERVRGFQDAMKEYPGIKIVAKRNGRQERDVALRVSEAMLLKYPGLKGIFSVNDIGALSALVAIETNDRNVKLVSVDGHPQAIQAILKPNSRFIATTAQYPRDQVRLGLAMALAKLWGSSVPEVVPVNVTLIDRTKASDFNW
ncbi:ABC transporter substrate-binding protein [Motiliproteus sp. MSK22-1]|uniref:ABC transporter substrate-binding protein n=1 Tax=Motiliproteus sp. MSK22-1 TaxID=1897630 RepID=UPI000976993A|nr:ABC transporter substrate-binding protein [Motiliproteus sp. MSK22-1]OMH38843.1 LacI family transcriptional regulator [Motiliproteus sp. MSK22-1]